VQALGDRQNTLIIDYGSENIKAGYDSSPDGPELIFRPQISKNRDASKADLPIKGFVNTSYDQI
jgi:actin-related protein